MKQYLDLVKTVLENGILSENRTGTKTLSYFGYFYKVNLQDGFPLLTTKKVNFGSVVHELFWYLSGKNHIRDLQKHTKIWDAWSDEEGRLETAYGRYWRKYPAIGISDLFAKEAFSKDSDYVNEDGSIDQIKYIINELKALKADPTRKSRRRLVVNAWHPDNALESKLPPCHYTFAFNISGGKLNCHLTQRSGDIALGIPFNLACYSLLTMMIAKETGWEVGEFAHTIIDAHIYEDHIEGLKKQLKREPMELCEVEIADKPFNELKFEDIKLVGYASHKGIKFPVAV